MDYEFPVKHFEDNLIFSTDGKVWGCYQMECEEYEMLSEEGKEQFVARLARFIAGIGEEAKILITPIKQDLEPSYQYTKSQIERGYPEKSGKVYEYAKAFNEATREILENAIVDGGGNNDYKVFVLTVLPKPKDAFEMKAFLDNPFKFTEDKMGFKSNAISEYEVEQYKTIAERYEKAQSGRFKLEKTPVETVEWLIGRVFLRGTVQEPKVRKNADGTPYTPKTDTLKVGLTKYKVPVENLDISNYRLRQKGRLLDIEDENGKITHQTFLEMSYMPDELNLPGYEWIEPLMDLSFGVEVCICIKTEDFRKAIRKLKENSRKIEGQSAHAHESGEVPDEDVTDAYIDNSGLSADLSVYNDPLVSMSVIICLANSDEEQLNLQVTRVKQEMESLQFRVQRPVSDTLRSFYAALPGSSTDFATYWFKTSPSVVATSVFPVAIESGDPAGHFIGTAGARRKYIFLALVEAIRKNRSAGTAILGTLGGGKSVLANYLGYMVTLLDGGRSLFIDPKSERGDLWKAYLTEFDGEIGITTIDWKDSGVFDPFVMYKPESPEWFENNKAKFDKLPNNSIHTYADYVREERQKAKDLANSMFTEEMNLSKESRANKKLAFQEALDAAARYGNASMTLVARILLGQVPEQYKVFRETDKVYDDAVLLGREMVQLKSTNKLANLIIGDGSETGLSFNKRINIMQIQGLDVPDPSMSKSDYSASQRTSATIMIPLGEFAKEFTRNPLLYDTPKAVIFDESWFLKATSQGKLLYSEIARTGRSFYAIPIFIGHSISDVDEAGIREALTYKFIFKMATDTETKAALKMLNLEETKANMELIDSLKNGECLFSDFHGRIQKIRIEILFSDILKAFETNPEKRKKLYDEIVSKKEEA